MSEGWSGRRGSNPRPTAWKAVTLPLSYSRLRAPRFGGAGPPTTLCAHSHSTRLVRAFPPTLVATGHPAGTSSHTCRAKRGRRQREALATRNTGVFPPTLQSACANQSSAHAPKRGWWGGEGSNLRSPKAAGLQPAAIDHSATSPDHCPGSGHDIRNQASLRPPSCLRKSRYICTYGIRGFDTSLGDAARFRWSWRRDLNPRPADYKSAALPD